MDGYSTLFYDCPEQYVDHKTVETLSREVTKIITEQLKSPTQHQTKTQGNKSPMK